VDIVILDLGSNSFHLLLARVRGKRRVAQLSSSKVALRLGDPVARTGQIPEHLFYRALDCIGDLLRSIGKPYWTLPVVAVGTSALREAKNGMEFLEAVRERYAIEVRMTSGPTEAALVYRGVCCDLPGLPSRVGVVDIGGGSVEVIVGEADRCLLVSSLPLGFLRVRQVLGDEPRAVRLHVWQEAWTTVAAARELMPRHWVFTGGTARALARVAKIRIGVRGGELSRHQLDALAEEISGLTENEMGRLGVDAGRCGTFRMGMAILHSLVGLAQIPAISVSKAGLREGIASLEFERLCGSRSNEENAGSAYANGVYLAG
jgi:exopolyphosphatase / guanosine-5'-triphosphate,3'-diphosphate pyrophosphatase